MKVKVISILEDNYMYLIIEETTREAIAVDAAVSKRVYGGDERVGALTHRVAHEQELK
ncbi:putative Hydroxyacylglutathione hydrolase-like protein, partial [Naja naja]